MTKPVRGMGDNLANLGGAQELVYKGSFYGNISSQLRLANCIAVECRIYRVCTRSVTERRCARELLMLVHILQGAPKCRTVFKIF